MNILKLLLFGAQYISLIMTADLANILENRSNNHTVQYILYRKYENEGQTRIKLCLHSLYLNNSWNLSTANNEHWICITSIFQILDGSNKKVQRQNTAIKGNLEELYINFTWNWKKFTINRNNCKNIGLSHDK